MIELLAPAGSYEAFEGAIGAGADAVYVGGNAFGARAYAQNFTQEELLAAIDEAHLHGKKLYLTVNTLVKNRELCETLYDYLRPYYERGLDAVIVQDLGVMEFIKRNFPLLPIHASTQMTVTGPAGMKFLEEKGVKRVVAARELSLEELSRMHQASALEIEAFIHGALCYCYSGQCLFSSMLGGRSGNRGRCAQPCRLPYQVIQDGRSHVGSSEIYALNLKDICTIDLLPQIIQAGVTSLKIEGRMKKPQYTAGVVSVYRKYLDLYEENPSAYRVQEEDRRFLLDIFNRGGSCQGYFKVHNGPEMMAFSNDKKAAGVPVEIRKKKEKIYGNLMLFPDSPAILEVSWKNFQAVASEGIVQKAKNQPMTRERIRRQMDKCGNSSFSWERLDVDMEEDIFVPVKVLNEVRRKAFEALKEEILSSYVRKVCEGPYMAVHAAKISKRKEPPLLYASCETAGQLEVLLGVRELRGIYAPMELLEDYFHGELPKEKEFYLSLPYLVRGQMPQEYWSKAEMLLQKGLKGFLVSGLEAYAMIKERGYASLCVADHSLYTWNQEAEAFWDREGILRNTVPLELNSKEISHRDNRSSELLVYGYLPLMVSAQCIKKNTGGCTGKKETLWLKDRYGKEFPAVCCCDPWNEGMTAGQICYNKIYNCLPMGLLGESTAVKELGVKTLRLSFTMEDARETKRIAKKFVDTYEYNKDAGEEAFTKGHFKRGVE